MKRLYFLIVLNIITTIAAATRYVGKVVDEKGAPLSYATVYLISDPIIGTATNSRGLFTIETDKTENEQVAITFLGYTLEKRELKQLKGDTTIITLKEQPIMLEEMVVDAPKTKHRNKNKPMAQLLYKVYQKMESDFPTTGVYYKIVSDVKFNTQNTPLAMEQMIAEIVQLPNANVWKKDTFQFRPLYCKRFLAADTRDKIDEVMSNQKLDKRLRKLAVDVDSGSRVHTTLWRPDYVKSDFVNSMEKLKKWSVTKENNGKTVLTYIDKDNIMGIYKVVETRNYILDSKDYTLLQFSLQWDLEINIPFGYKLKKEHLKILNLLNVSDTQIEKFRVKHIIGTYKYNTLYERSQGISYVKENNMTANGVIQGSKGAEIPINIRATQHVTERRLGAKKIKQARKIKREIVPIY